MDKPKRQKYKDIDDYISAAPEDIRPRLEQIRQTISKAAPNAAEVISYGIPAFKLHTVLVYFAAFKDHIGFFPTSSGISNFKKELAGYDTSKGTVRLPLDEPLPLELITRIVKFRLQEDLAKAKP